MDRKLLVAPNKERSINLALNNQNRSPDQNLEDGQTTFRDNFAVNNENQGPLSSQLPNQQQKYRNQKEDEYEDFFDWKDDQEEVEITQNIRKNQNDFAILMNSKLEPPSNAQYEGAQDKNQYPPTNSQRGNTNENI